MTTKKDNTMTYNKISNIRTMASENMLDELNVSGIEPSVWSSILMENADTTEEADERIAEELAEYSANRLGPNRRRR